MTKDQLECMTQCNKCNEFYDPIFDRLTCPHKIGKQEYAHNLLVELYGELWVRTQERDNPIVKKWLGITANSPKATYDCPLKEVPLAYQDVSKAGPTEDKIYLTALGKIEQRLLALEEWKTDSVPLSSRIATLEQEFNMFVTNRFNKLEAKYQISIDNLSTRLRELEARLENLRSI